MAQSTSIESSMGSQTSLSLKFSTDDEVFDRPEVRARLPLPSQAEMGLRRLVDKHDKADVGFVEVGFVLPREGNAGAVDLDSRGQRLDGAIS